MVSLATFCCQFAYQKVSFFLVRPASKVQIPKIYSEKPLWLEQLELMKRS